MASGVVILPVFNLAHTASEPPSASGMRTAETCQNLRVCRYSFNQIINSTRPSFKNIGFGDGVAGNFPLVGSMTEPTSDHEPSIESPVRRGAWELLRQNMERVCHKMQQENEKRSCNGGNQNNKPEPPRISVRFSEIPVRRDPEAHARRCDAPKLDTRRDMQE